MLGRQPLSGLRMLRHTAQKRWVSTGGRSGALSRHAHESTAHLLRQHTTPGSLGCCQRREAVSWLQVALSETSVQTVRTIALLKHVWVVEPGREMHARRLGGEVCQGGVATEQRAARAVGTAARHNTQQLGTATERPSPSVSSSPVVLPGCAALSPTRTTQAPRSCSLAPVPKSRVSG